ncbi:MAG: putative GTP-binding protein EngB [Candidatus Magasanikbacteria bacterium GW2011_GWC2_37_14]|uniref:Probable GTP-binding protein EngB n=1 Tax=Candidatus Magasanikbacteria bacterium GW2011_GWC2_37_14 TaxID=1619046 RepID=A0A0G0G961_9BACT|nr:MAG: putative GTP-binding protein EngB [Candidatus Magasanikbacteria bacterium GW2011_GWC2_37_14]
MNIKSAVFVKSAIGTDDLFENGTPQVVFIGRSNVGKSSVINSLVNQKSLAKTSSMPGRTQQLNVFLINKALYFVDIPGYGFANIPEKMRLQIHKMVSWYLFDSNYVFKKVVLIIDAKVGPTADDLDIFENLERENKDVVIVANKIDKIKKSEYEAQMQEIKKVFNNYKVFPFSAEKKTGVGELTEELLK